MLLLSIVSLVWAFSFGLIGNELAGLPPAWMAWIRLAISAAVFLPFVRRVPGKTALALFAVGAVQFGFMYLAYMTSFRHLQSHEVALFTVVTPLFVAGLDDLFGRKFRPWNLLAALLAVGGAGLIKWQSMGSAAPLKGILLVQVSNLLFAAGQLAYRAVMARLDQPVADHRVFFWLHFGGFAVLTPLAWPIALAATPPAPTLHQWAILGYLGLVASGICFFLWNRGARFVSAGQLAVMNNLKIPLGVAVSLCFFPETAGLPTLLAGSLLLAAAFLPLRRAARGERIAMSPPVDAAGSDAIGGQLTEADYVAAQFLHLRPRPVFAGAGFLLLALAAGALWYRFTFTLLACLLLLGFHFGIWLPFKSRRLFRQYKALSDPMAVEVRADGLFFQRPTGEDLLPWTHVRKWRHNRKLVLLYPADNVFHLVPRHFFPDPRAYDDFLATLTARAGKPS